MLSILEQIGKKSPDSKAKKTRQITLPRAFSRVEDRKASDNSQHASSTPPSMTTGASNTDNSSELNEDSTKLDDSQGDLGPIQAGLDSENELSSSALSPSSQKGLRSWGKSRDVSGATTLVEKKIEVSEQLLQESVQVLNDEMDIDTNPVKTLQRSSSTGVHVSETVVTKPRPRHSARRVIIDKAFREVERTTNVLGKRARDTVENVTDQATALYGVTRERLRDRATAPPAASTEHPPAKKTRLSQAAKKDTSPEPVVPKRMQKLKKTYLDKGLYVGQDRDFNPRLTEAQNTKRLGHNMSLRKPAMPLPMYSGQKAIEKGRNFKLPYEVFSPLPGGQPKPDEWKKTQKNVFIGEAASLWKKPKKLEDSVCDCTPEDGCDEQCFNRSMLYECDDKNCNLGQDRCTNRNFADLKTRLKAGGLFNVGVEVVKTAEKGYGLRACRAFAPNQIIVEYTGEIITKDECEIRVRDKYKGAACYYLMDFHQGMILDATRGSIARFVNHDCSPNCHMEKWTVQGVPRMALFAGEKGITTGQELTYDYNFTPFSIKNIQECRCGSDNCRGVLGPKPKEAKERELRDALNPIAGGKKRKLQQIAEDAVKTVKNVTKKRKLEMPKLEAPKMPTATSIKDAIMRSQLGTKSSLMPKPKQTKMEKVEPKPTRMEEVEAMEKARVQLKEKAKSQAKEKDKAALKEKEKQKPKNGTKPKLPIGWVYTEELEEPPPPVVRNIFAHDPEALLRSQKRKFKQESQESGTPQKKQRTTSGETLIEGDSGRRSSQKSNNDVEAENAGTPQKKQRTASGETLIGRESLRPSPRKSKNQLEAEDEGAEAVGNNKPTSSGMSNMRAKAKQVKKSIVRTMQGRHGRTTPVTPGEKSIWEIADEQVETEAEVEEEEEL